MQNPLRHLFRCIACHDSLSDSSCLSSLCEGCQTSLIPSPPLCSMCSSVDCPSECLRPWRETPYIDSFSAKYLMLGQGYAVLKSWKRHRGLWFDQIVLKPDARLLQVWTEFQPDALVPIPQRASRAWKLGGNRAEIIAEKMSVLLRKPLHLALGVDKKERQGELNLNQRAENPLHFFVTPQGSTQLKTIQRVILVDDFKTTGSTLEKAAESLKRWGVTHIHAFTLGIRPPFLNTQSSSDLLQSTRRSVSIRQDR
jgi:predicted amidophosphoribosyltransferase